MAPKQPSSIGVIKQIASLEASLLANLSDPNNLLPLLGLARHASPEVVHKAIWALHRVFIPLISSGKVGVITSTSLAPRGGDAETEVGSGREVMIWVRERLIEYLEILGGLLRDSEAALRASALPLLFSLLPPLSTSGVHTIYFRIILDALIYPTSSLRGASPRKTGTSASPRWIIVPANQVSDEAGVLLVGVKMILPQDVITLVVDDFWAKFDDLRLLFFREARHLLESTSGTLVHPANLLGQLFPLTNLPRKQVDLNAFFIPSVSSPPPLAEPSNKKSKPNPTGKKAKSAKEAEVTPEWMAAYDSSDSDGETNGSGKRPRERTSKLNFHAAIHSTAAHTSAYTYLYIAVLSSVPLDEAWTRKILVGLHGSSGILGYMRADKRVRVADWLGSLVDKGGVEGMLAVNGLFVLMTQYNLDYPNFYPRLYSLLTPSLLHTRHRARFFRLLDTFLRSALLPSALVASFIKRLSRLALTAPPGGVVLVLPFVYGLMKRHVGCMGMLQRYDEGGWQDPYDPNDPSPFTSKAIDSSLWELASMQNHYLASVSTMSGIFKEQFTKPEFALEDFLDHGYATLFETELQRKIKYPPALAISLELDEKIRPALFGSAKVKESSEVEDGSEGVGGDLVSQLWAF